MSIIKDFSKYPNFNPLKDAKMSCTCCGLLEIDENFMDAAQRARTMAKTLFRVTSLCRCEQHNIKVGGAISSDHVARAGSPSSAMDVEYRDMTECYDIIWGAMAAGLEQIIVYQSKKNRAFG